MWLSCILSNECVCEWEGERARSLRRRKHPNWLRCRRNWTIEEMNRLYASGDFSSSCSSDTDDGSSSDDDGNETIFPKKRHNERTDANCGARKSTSQNIIFKLQNREVWIRFWDAIVVNNWTHWIDRGFYFILTIFFHFLRDEC